MANENPTGGARPVPLDLPVKHIPVLRSCLNDWLHGVREDLKHPERLQHPDKARKEAQAFERLLVALATRQIVLPDDVARAAVQAAADDHDAESNYTETVTNHNALRALLGVLEGESA
ncbi:MAG TPA: hypothetical protein VNO20_06910 [Solirubrobacterales bacterium]|nr:hypothetical protein [Solirubrobacterales bacterium]